MITKSKKAPGTVFYVKMDEEGKKFLANLKKHLNCGEYRMCILGRNENRKRLAEADEHSHDELRQRVMARVHGPQNHGVAGAGQLQARNPYGAGLA